MPKKNVPNPGNVGPQSGPERAPVSRQSEEPKAPAPAWTRGNDPTAAAEALLQANRGSTGGATNMPVPKYTS